jgi:hypothetical protein
MFSKIKISPLFSDSVISDVFEIRKFIITNDLWQRNLLDSSRYFSQLNGYHLGNLHKEQLFSLSKFNILIADKVTIKDDYNFNFLKEIGNEYFVFNCLNKKEQIDLTCIFTRNKSEVNQVELYFHPYRAFEVYKLRSALKNPVWDYQGFSIKGLKSINEEHEKRLETYLKSGNIWDYISVYSRIVDLCIVTEICFHDFIFNSVSSRNRNSYEDTVSMKNKIKTDLKKIYQAIGVENINLIRQALVGCAEMADENSTVHALLRMMKADERLKLKGKLGFSMLLLEMAEFLRRASEYYFDIKLPEENKARGQWYFEDFMKQQFGSTRILDEPATKAEFIRYLGLDYTLRARIYVEGITEYSFLKQVFSGIQSVQLINLKGNFVEKNGKGLSFRESLIEDQKACLFSFVFLDDDVKDNIRVLKVAISDGSFFGMFFKSDPDFEGKNFTAEELYEAYCDYYGVSFDSGFSFGKDKTNGKSFERTMRELHPNIRFSKSEEWGKALYRFICKSENKERPLIKFIYKIFRSLNWGYEGSKQTCVVDEQTGFLISKDKYKK